MTTTLTYSIENLQAQLVHTKKTLVQSVSFSVSAGESLALIGETGSGKTLIAQSIMGVLPENVLLTNSAISFCGNVLPSGKKLRSMLGMDIVYIPQNGHEFLNPSRKIRQHLYDSLKRLGIPAAKRRQAACEKLFLAGFSEPEAILEQYPFQLSGGMAQRVTIALALCSRAKLLIADEPTNGLDQTGKQQFMSVLCTLFPDSAKLVITHDISVASACDRILVLCKGRMLETGAACDVLSKPQHPYTKALLNALVENGMQETPFLRKESGACPFYRRCPLALEQCRNEIRLQKTEDRKWWCCAE